MQKPGPGKKVTILLRKPAERQGYLRILEVLKAEGVTNAVAFRTVAAVDSVGHIELNKLVEIPVELPTVILWNDTAERVERILPRVQSIIEDGIVTVDETSVVFVASRALPDLPPTVRVESLMTREVVSVQPSTPMREVVADLVTRSFRAVPVIGDDGKLVGIITNSDLVRRGGLPFRLDLLKTFDTPELHQRLDAMTAQHATAEEVMTTDVVTVHPELDVRHAADLMIRRNLKRIPVVDADGRLVGMLSRVDILLSVIGTPEKRTGAEELSTAFNGATPVGSVMSRAVPAVSPDAPVRDVVNVIAATRLNRAVVVDEERRVLGIINDAGLMERLDPKVRPGVRKALMRHVPFFHLSREDEEIYRHAKAKLARDLMRADIVTAVESDQVREVLAAMLNKGAKVVPIVDRSGRLQGIVDRRDLLRGLVNQEAGADRP